MVYAGKVPGNIYRNVAHIKFSAENGDLFFMIVRKVIGLNRNNGLGQCSTDVVG